MSNCNNCFNGCTETISDQCIKYTGIDVPDLGIRTGDSLSFVEQALITSLTSTLGGEGITIDLSNIDICTLVQNYLPSQPPSEGFTLNDILAALIQVSCSTQSQLVSNYNSTNALINTQHTTFADANSAMASLITTISATMDADRSHTAALVRTEQTARVTANSALASLITTLSGEVNTAKANISGLITSISNIEVTDTSALAEQVNTLSATFTTGNAAALEAAAAAQTTANNASNAAAAAALTASNATTVLNNISSDNLLTPGEKRTVILSYDTIIAEKSGIDAQATNYNITTEKTTYGAAISNLTTYLATLTTPVLWNNVTGNTTIVGTTFRSKFQDVYVSKQALLNKIAAKAKDLINSVSNDISGLYTAINEEITVRASETEALAQSITEISATGVDTNYINGIIDARISDELTTLVNADGALALSINNLSSTVNDHTASINTTQQTLADYEGNLSASYGLNVDANGHIASMNLLSDGTSSEIIFKADEFKIYNNNGSGVAPFTVVDGNVILTGTTVVDSIVTPGTGPAIGVTGWNGLSLNKTNDNLLQFRHPNGAIGMKMGIVGGVLTLKWYNDSGVLIWEGGSGGIKAIENTAASYAGQITNVGRIRVNKDGVVSVEGDIANQLGGYVYTSRLGALPTSISTSIGWQFTGTSPAGMAPNNGYEYVSFTSIVPGSAGINSRIDIVLKNDPGTKYKINLYDESIGFGGFGLYATPTAVKKSSTNYQGTDPFVNSTISIFDGLTDYTDVERYIYFETQTIKF